MHPRQGKEILPVSVKEIKYLLYTGLRNGQGIDHKLLAGAVYCCPESRVYRIKLMMFPRHTYYMQKNQSVHDHYTVFAKRANDQGRNRLYAPVGSAALDTSLQSYLEIKFPLLKASVFMSLYPCEENQ
jgi:hypothetical protein